MVGHLRSNKWRTFYRHKTLSSTPDYNLGRYHYNDQCAGKTVLNDDEFENVSDILFIEFDELPVLVDIVIFKSFLNTDTIYEINFDFLDMFDDNLDICVLLIDDFIRFCISPDGEHRSFDIYPMHNKIDNFDYVDCGFMEDYHLSRGHLTILRVDEETGESDSSPFEVPECDQIVQLCIEEPWKVYWCTAFCRQSRGEADSSDSESFDKKKMVDLTLKHFERQVHTTIMLTFCDFDINFYYQYNGTSANLI